MLIGSRRTLLTRRQVVASVANNISLDGFNTAQSNSVALSTTFGNDFIGCVLTQNAAVITGVSSPNIGSFTNRAFTGPTVNDMQNQIQFWFAKAPTTHLLSELIT